MEHEMATAFRTKQSNKAGVMISKGTLDESLMYLHMLAAE